MPAPSPVLMPLPPTPNPSPSPAPPMSRSCVPTLDAPFNDASIYGPLCTTLGNANTCPSPLCRWSEAQFLASSAVGRKTSATKKPHYFLGVSLMQDRIINANNMKLMQEKGYEADEVQLTVHAPSEL